MDYAVQKNQNALDRFTWARKQDFPLPRYPSSHTFVLQAQTASPSTWKELVALVHSSNLGQTAEDQFSCFKAKFPDWIPNQCSKSFFPFFPMAKHIYSQHLRMGGFPTGASSTILSQKDTQPWAYSQVVWAVEFLQWKWATGWKVSETNTVYSKTSHTSVTCCIPKTTNHMNNILKCVCNSPTMMVHRQ